MSGNRENPNKIRKVSVDMSAFGPAIIPEFRTENRDEFRPRTCPICHGIAMTRVMWNDKHGVCMLCFHGQAPRMPLLQDVLEEEWNDDDEEYVDDDDDDEW